MNILILYENNGYLLIYKEMTLVCYTSFL